jgi:single-stranded DNA-binding protein
MATSNINRVVLTGNLTRDPVLRNTSSGTPVCGLRIASNTRRKTSGGEWVDKPNYLSITVWGALGENCHRFLAKGRPVAIDGSDSTVGIQRRSQLRQRHARTSPRGSRLGVTGGRESGHEVRCRGAVQGVCRCRHSPLDRWLERRRTLAVGALLCILGGGRRGRGWAAPRRAVSCAALVVADRAGGVEGVVGRWETVDAVGASGWLVVSRGAFSDRCSWARSYEDLWIVERAD